MEEPYQRTDQPLISSAQSKFRQKPQPEKKPRSKKMEDRMLVRDLKNLEGIGTEAAVKKLMERRMEEAKKEREVKPKEKTVVDQNQMPWNPRMGMGASVFILPHGSFSALNIDMHRRYVAILTNFLQPEVKTRFVYNDIEIKNFDERLVPERTEFNRLVAQRFRYQPRFQGSIYRYVPPGAFEYIKERILAKLSTLSSKGYSKLSKELSWSSSDPSEAGMAYPRKQLVLHEGTPKERYIIPDVRRKCVFSLAASAIAEIFPAEKVTEDPIEEDQFAVELAATNKVEVIMNACTVRHFLTAPWPNRSDDYVMKVTIRRHVHEGKITRICFIGKPIPTTLNPLSCMRMFMKYVVRNGIRKPEPKPTQLKQPRRLPVFMRKRRPEFTPSQAPAIKIPRKKAEDSTEMGNLIIAESDEDEKPMKSPKGSIAEVEKKQVEKKPVEKTKGDVHHAYDDLLGSILGDMDAYKNKAEKPQEETEGFLDINKLLASISEAQKTDTPSNFKQYRIYAFDAKEEKRILIRATPHGIDQQKIPVVVQHKVEYMPAAGAEKMTQEEVLWNALTANLKGGEHHLRFHMHFEEGDALQLARTMAKPALAQLKEDEKKLLSRRSERLSSLIDTLHQLDFGEYLISQADNKLSFFLESETDADEESSMFTQEKLKQTLSELKETPHFEEIFQGIDPHLILVWHIIQGRIPGSFIPFKEGLVPKKLSPKKKGDAHSISAKRRARRQRKRNEKRLAKEGSNQNDESSDNESLSGTSTIETMSSSTKSMSLKKDFVQNRGGRGGGGRGRFFRGRGGFRGRWQWSRGGAASGYRNMDKPEGESYQPIDWDAPDNIA